MAENHLNEFPTQIRLEKPAPRDWPSFEQVERDYPQLCMEEQVMMFDSLILQARERKQRENN